jgi:tRNA pseudouridine55 synthase
VAESISGVVVVDKPAGMTSHDVVNRLRKVYGTRSVGHAGTLDPLATGVLVACIGKATKILEFLSATSKRYRAGMLFGIRTDTQDITGEERSRADASGLTRDDVEAELPRFRGRILQVPPMHSALHHEGQRLYDLARRGVEVERAAREIEIHRLDLLEFERGRSARGVFDVACSSGTYIRTLAADIGDAVGTGAVMESLRRTEVGAFGMDRSYSLERLEELKAAGRLEETIRPIADALSDWPRIPLTAQQATDIRHGRKLRPPSGAPVGNCLLVGDRGEAVALARSDGEWIAPFKVLISGE